MQTVVNTKKVVAGLAHQKKSFLEIDKLANILTSEANLQPSLGSKYTSVPYITYLSKSVLQHQEDGCWNST